MTIRKIVSGGQTGVDRAALDVARELQLEHGGWCPRGRLAEDGRIPDQYLLWETVTAEYAERTELNVRDSDGTLVLTVGAPMGGTLLTIECATQWRKPCLVVDLTRSAEPGTVRLWLDESHIAVLNVAGPRHCQSPEGYQLALQFLRECLVD
jgi:hypothetical protein